MSGFGEYFKNEKRNNTLSFFNSFFNTLFNKKGWYFIFFWIFLSATIFGLYKILTLEDKFPVECGKIVKIDIDQNINNDAISYHLFINVNNKIEDFTVSRGVYEKYDTISKTDKNITYCESYTNKIFVFYIMLTILLAIISICFLVSSSD